MKNKTALLLILVAGVLMTISTSCTKYEDGPMFSLRTKTERVSNTWKIDNYKINGNDYTSIFSGYTETYTKDGNFSYNWEMFGGTGNWEFQNNNKEILLDDFTSQPAQTLYILKLEEKEFWYYYLDGSDRKEFHLIEN